MTTQKSEHTPPPWQRDGLIIRSPSPDGMPIATMSGRSLNPAENQANSDVVTASPEMLSLLKRLSEMNLDGRIPTWVDIWDEVDAVIAKAEGRDGDSPA